MVNFLKSHDNLHDITYRVKIILKGIAQTRDKIGTMYDPQIIYDTKKDTLESVET